MKNILYRRNFLRKTVLTQRSKTIFSHTLTHAHVCVRTINLLDRISVVETNKNERSVRYLRGVHRKLIIVFNGSDWVSDKDHYLNLPENLWYVIYSYKGNNISLIILLIQKNIISSSLFLLQNNWSRQGSENRCDRFNTHKLRD